MKQYILEPPFEDATAQLVVREVGTDMWGWCINLQVGKRLRFTSLTSATDTFESADKAFEDGLKTSGWKWIHSTATSRFGHSQK